MIVHPHLFPLPSREREEGINLDKERRHPHTGLKEEGQGGLPALYQDGSGLAHRLGENGVIGLKRRADHGYFVDRQYEYLFVGDSHYHGFLSDDTG